MRHGTAATLAIVVAMTLAACAPEKGASVEGPVAVYEPTSLEVPTPADDTGTIAITGGCLVLRETDADAFVPQFPADYVEWDPDAEALHYGGQTYTEGDTLTVTLGGQAPRGSAPEHCSTTVGRFGHVAPLEAAAAD